MLIWDGRDSMGVNYSKYILNPTEFINIPVMKIIEFYETVNNRLEKYGNLNNREMDFYIYFNSLWSEYQYMTEELNRNQTDMEGRLKYVLEKIISGERFTPIYILEKPKNSKDSKKRIVKLNCLVDGFLNKYQSGNQKQLLEPIPKSELEEPYWQDWN
jgi:hypothetical protein